MQHYASLFAYLNHIPVEVEGGVLPACDRPILSIDHPLDQSLHEPFLIPPLSELYPKLYEIAFPYLKPQLLQQHPDRLELPWELDGQSYKIADEVLDQGSVEEDQLDVWRSTLGQQLDCEVAELLLVLTGLFAHVFRFSNRRSQRPEIRLMELSQQLEEFKPEEARQPLIISLETQYQLQEKLELIASKLRQQLRRQAELMPVGRIQEMDTYCLRDYIRRPGQTPAEKAGSKQELMGIQRYQDYNTAENKFLVFFAEKVLHLECSLYLNSADTQYKLKIEQFRQLIDRFQRQPEVKQIQARQYQFTQPNYVLQQNPIYSSFYQAFLYYLQRKSEKEGLWAFRNHLLADAVYLCLLAALTQFQGAITQPLDTLSSRTSPEYGRLLKAPNAAVKVYLQQQVYGFRLQRSPDHASRCDLHLTLEIHLLDSRTLEMPAIQELLIWIFWYRPTPTALAQANLYCQQQLHQHQQGQVLYLQSPPASDEPFIDPPWLHQLPNWNTPESGMALSAFLSTLIQNWVESRHE